MKLFKFRPLLLLILFLIPVLVQAQDRNTEGQITISYELRFNESDFERLKSMSAEEGISMEKFGIWMERAGNVMIKIESPKENGFTGESSLVMFLTDAGGRVLNKQQVGLKVSTRPGVLSSATGGQLGRAASMTGFKTFIPQGHYPPQMKEWKSQREAEREAIELAQRAMRSTRSTHAIVVMALPAVQSKGEASIFPGLAVFTGVLE